MDYLEFVARVTSHIPEKGHVSLEGEPASRFPLQGDFEDAGNRTFTKNMGMPVSIEKTITTVVQNALRKTG